jgi:hypothetical protein
MVRRDATKALRPADARYVEGTLRRLGAQWEAPESHEITGAGKTRGVLSRILDRELRP